MYSEDSELPEVTTSRPAMTNVCRSCGEPFQWGFCDGRWVLLEPIDTHDDLDRTFIDENGILRADHRDRHGGPTVNVVRLDRKVPAPKVLESVVDEHECQPKQEAPAPKRHWLHRVLFQ